MKITIEITTNNAAFEDNEAGETAGILRKLAKRLAEDGNPLSVGDSIPTIDANGNKVGQLTVTED